MNRRFGVNVKPIASIRNGEKKNMIAMRISIAMILIGLISSPSHLLARR
jgi:hypothetical protein